MSISSGSGMESERLITCFGDTLQTLRMEVLHTSQLFISAH
jgi:hypothetical protein